MTHRCPGPQCAEQIPFERLACRRHWYQVPVGLRSLVWAAWRGGRGAGTEAHAEAMRRAVATMRPL